MCYPKGAHSLGHRRGQLPTFGAFSNGWSKSIVLENKVVINFDFRNEAKKSGHLDYPLWPQIGKYAQICIFTNLGP